MSKKSHRKSVRSINLRINEHKVKIADESEKEQTDKGLIRL